MTLPTPPPIAASDLPEGWPELVREIIVRCGHATRGLGAKPVIEIKSLTRNTWHPLGLPGGGTLFASFDDRNLILAKLQGK